MKPYCHSDDQREEESRVHLLITLLCVSEILRFALNDKNIGNKQ